jgi:glycerol uptake facilitator-like aquaporin
MADVLTFHLQTALMPVPSQVPGYIVAQLAGAITASGILRALFGLEGQLGVTVPTNSWIQSFVLEIVLTFFLVFVITAMATDNKSVCHSLHPDCSPLPKFKFTV